MALFKILRGSSTSLASQPLVDGYAYFTPDDGRFYIDAALTTAPDYYIASSNGIYRIEVESGTLAELNDTKKTKQTAVSDPTASGTSTSFISGITQNANGVISPTKKNLPTASTSAAGIVQLNTAINSTSDTLAATSSAVKSAYDIGAAAIPKSTLSGAFDVLYSSAANTPARLAANTTTTKKFLRMTGTGSAGAAPAWDTVTKSDVGLGNVTNDAQIPKSIGTAAGDIIYWSAASTPVRLGKGSDGQVLKLASGVPTWSTDNNTLNTAGSTDTSSKIFLVGATSQAANPQTYSDNQVYATNGQLDANKVRVAEAVTLQYNSTTKSLDFIFA